MIYRAVYISIIIGAIRRILRKLNTAHESGLPRKRTVSPDDTMWAIYAVALWNDPVEESTDFGLEIFDDLGEAKQFLKCMRESLPECLFTLSSNISSFDASFFSDRARKAFGPTWSRIHATYEYCVKTILQ